MTTIIVPNWLLYVGIGFWSVSIVTNILLIVEKRRFANAQRRAPQSTPETP